MIVCKIAKVGEIMKIEKKLIMIIAIFIIVIFLNGIEAFGWDGYTEETSALAEGESYRISSSKFQDPVDNPDFWDPVESDESELADKAGILLGVIATVGVVAAVIILVLLGMKYLLGSVEEKANLKKSMLIYILGIIFLVACTVIPNIIYNFSHDVFG